jgi:hypothetical protein
MATKIPFYTTPASQFNTICPEMVYNPVIMNFYVYLGSDFNPDNEVLGMEFAKWGCTYMINKEYILFEQDEDATLFLLRFS